MSNLLRNREKLIAEYCSGLVRDLRLIDPFSYAVFFHLGQVFDLTGDVTAIVERNFPGGHMQFAGLGEALIDWRQKPVVVLDFEFLNLGVSLFFRIVIDAKSFEIELHHIAFEAPDDEQKSNPCNEERLEEALLKACANRSRNRPKHQTA